MDYSAVNNMARLACGMPPRKKFSPDFESSISGIPCGIRVDRVHITQGNYSSLAETPEEYSGIRDIEFTVLDRRGYEASWLADKLTDEDVGRIEDEIVDDIKGAQE